jgi:hypothetical protein
MLPQNLCWSDRYYFSLCSLVQGQAVQALQAPLAFQVQVERLLMAQGLILPMCSQLSALIGHL